MTDNSCFGGFDFGAWTGRSGRRFRWRIFERGDLKFVILRKISEKPMHGYELMQALEEGSRGTYKPSPGSVYPTLQMLEDQGLLRSREEEGKKIYEITDEGRRYLEENGDVVAEIFDRVDSFKDRFLGKDNRELSGAFSRLAQITFESAFAWELDRESLAKMADVLDRARKDIEEIRGGRGRKKERAGAPKDEDQQG